MDGIGQNMESKEMNGNNGLNGLIMQISTLLLFPYHQNLMKNSILKKQLNGSQTELKDLTMDITISYSVSLILQIPTYPGF